MLHMNFYFLNQSASKMMNLILFIAVQVIDVAHGPLVTQLGL